jgi:hypothetical protein
MDQSSGLLPGFIQTDSILSWTVGGSDLGTLVWTRFFGNFSQTVKASGLWARRDGAPTAKSSP